LQVFRQFAWGALPLVMVANYYSDQRKRKRKAE
jgi:hypothetical protein